MLTYAREERLHLSASPERVFAVLADVAHHDRLAGSGEVKSIRILDDGPVGVRTEWEADEEIVMTGSSQKFVARSTMREFTPPLGLSWTSTPPTKPVARRIQWWYRLEPSPGDGGTDVVERVEVDFGPVLNAVMKLPYRLVRARYVASGMRRTLANLAASTGR